MHNDNIEDVITGKLNDKQIQQLLERIEKNKGVVGLLVVSQSSWKLFLRQIWIGIGRGLGMTVGCSIVIGIIYQILSYLISIDIPYLTELLKQVVAIIKGVN